MTKFVAVVMILASTIVFSASAMAEGWKIGNWEPPTKAPVLKPVSLNVDWGTTAAPASPVVVVAPMATHAAAGCSGARSYYGGRRFLGWRIMANRQARSQARMGSGHS